MNSFLESPFYLEKQVLISHTYTKIKQNTSQIEKICDKFQMIGIGNKHSWILKGRTL